MWRTYVLVLIVRFFDLMARFVGKRLLPFTLTLEPFTSINASRDLDGFHDAGDELLRINFFSFRLIGEHEAMA